MVNKDEHSPGKPLHFTGPIVEAGEEDPERHSDNIEKQERPIKTMHANHQTAVYACDVDIDSGSQWKHRLLLLSS